MIKLAIDTINMKEAIITNTVAVMKIILRKSELDSPFNKNATTYTTEHAKNATKASLKISLKRAYVLKDDFTFSVSLEKSISQPPRKVFSSILL